MALQLCDEGRWSCSAKVFVASACSSTVTAPPDDGGHRFDARADPYPGGGSRAGQLYRREAGLLVPRTAVRALAEGEYQDKTSRQSTLPSLCHTHGRRRIDCARRSWQRQRGHRIWTTTPWTLPANEAVALRSDLTLWSRRCIAGSVRGSCVRQGLPRSALRVTKRPSRELARFFRAALAGLALRIPPHRQVPVILGVLPARSRTGSVHTAPHCAR